MHQNRASPVASDSYRRRGYRREFRNEVHFYPLSSQRKSRFASDFLRRGNRASWGLKKSRDEFFPGAVKIAAATAENRAILVHSWSCNRTLLRRVLRRFFKGSAS